MRAIFIWARSTFNLIQLTFAAFDAGEKVNNLLIANQLQSKLIRTKKMKSPNIGNLEPI